MKTTPSAIEFFLQKRENEREEEVLQEEEAPTHILTIHLVEITGLIPVYPISDVQLTVQFGDEIIFESERTPMSQYITLEQDIIQPIDINDIEIINKYITTPLVISLLEYPASVPEETIFETGNPKDSKDAVCGKILWQSEESILDLEEALYGKRTEDIGSQSKKSVKKTSSIKKTKSSRSSQASKTSNKSKSKLSRKSKTKKESEVEINKTEPSGPQIAGTAIVDMVALFVENTAMVESLVLKAPAGQPLDDRMKSTSNLPTLQIEICLNQPLPRGNMFYYTVESMYNLPKVMTANMNYQMVIGIPTSSKYKLVPFYNFTYAEEPRELFTFKKYYGSPDLSKFILKDDFDDVKTNLKMELSDAFYSDFPRLEYNVIKGEFASDDEVSSFKAKVTVYRFIGIEIYMTNPAIMGAVPSKSRSNKDDKEDKKSRKESRKGSKFGLGKSDKGAEPVEAKQEEYLHLMAFVDICRLLYPGEQRVRTACEVRTFNLEEFERTCGLKDSYFRPKPPPPDAPEPKKAKPEVKESKSKIDKSSKGKDSKASKDKSKAESKKVADPKKGLGDLQSKLTIPPELPLPSEPVYNEQGYPTFIIVEFEFREPIIPKKEIKDLHDELKEIVRSFPQAPADPKVYKSKYVAQDLFQNSIKTLFQNLKQSYLQYLQNNGAENNLLDFIEYITRSQEYQVYLNTLTKSAASYCNIAKRYRPEWSVDEYHAFIGQAYVDLIGFINLTLTQIGIAEVEAVNEPAKDTDTLLFYAKEATEIDAFNLGQQYYLRRIASNDTSADYWLDYAIFNLQANDSDAALECVIEALQYDSNNNDCLLFFATLQARAGKFSEAETCLLNVTISNPRWLEGWMALYCVYQRSKYYEGMELCLEMSQKYAKIKNSNRFEDLGWCSTKLPDRYTFRAITYFINLRLLEEAELIIADELLRKNTDSVEYLLSVLSLLKGNFDHAFVHIEMSLKMGGCTYAKNLVRGHIFMGMNKLDCALVEYEKITKSTEDDIPYDASIHMVYVRSGLCYSALGMDQSARKILLQASEKHGTAYTWLATGVLYYYQHDYLSSEECLTISNTLDNMLPETWAYLTLVNIKLGRPNEATCCYHQAIDHRLQNQELITSIDKELQQWENDFCNSSTKDKL